ncbi:hypothetical protein CRUP_010741 [Coryphaenoides rupestris]|nr:hypothetical protein CRUP_010741 [Coryphaenoides rupestris]
MESSGSDLGSEFEAQFEPGRKRKRRVPLPSRVPRKMLRHKAPVRLTPSSPSPSPGTPRQASPPSREKQAQAIRAEDIYEAVRSGKSATVTIVDEWIDSYKQDREAGLLVLINFIVKCCGCKGAVTRAMFDKMQNAEIISMLTKGFKEESANYPLSSPGPQWKRFRTGLFELVRVLVSSCQNSLLYDDYLFSSLLDLLIGLSDSQVRAFRHTSTLLAMKLNSAVVEVGVAVSTQQQIYKRRYVAESSKTPQDQASQRLDELQAVIKEEHREELKLLVNSTVRGVFVHRYRDHVPDIRAACLQELGVWMRSDPESFLNDGYLKYLGWMLSDKQAVVRLQCVCALQALYQERDFLGRLEFFTSRFKCHYHGAYLVDSLWDVAGSELRDWETMTSLLLQGCEQGQGLSYQEEGALLELMLCTIRQAAQVTPPVGRAKGKRMNFKDKTTQLQDKRHISSHFIPLMPQLLAKYSADGDKVSLLLQVPLNFDLETYTSAERLEKACARLTSALCSDAYTFSARANRAIGQLLDRLAECFTHNCDELVQGSADEDEVYSVSMTLKRIAAYSSSASAEVLRLKKAMQSFCSMSQRCLMSAQAEVRDQAFLLLCDLLLVYSAGSVRSRPALRALALPPPDPLRSEMAAFLIDYVFADSQEDPPDRDEEEEEKDRSAALLHKRNLLAGYCKLVIFGVLNLSAATDVFKHYFKYYMDFGDIIKETLSKTRQISPVQSAKTVCLCLQQLFSEVVSTGSSREGLADVRDLAKKLAMSFGIDLRRLRQPLVSLHMDGIRFAFRALEKGRGPLPNLAFLEFLSEFSFKLMRQDRTQLAAFLKAECPNAATSWPPVRMYQHSLQGRSLARPREEVQEAAAGEEEEEEDEVVVMASVAKHRKTNHQDSLSSTKGGAWLDSSSIHSNLPTPDFSSTVLKGQGRTMMEEEEETNVHSTTPSMRKVRSTARRQVSCLPGPGPQQPQQDLEAGLTLLSLIEEGAVESEAEPEIEDFERGSETHSSYTQVNQSLLQF